MLARYLGFASAADNTNRHLGYTYRPPSKEEWTYGLRDFRCLAMSWPADQVLVGSVRGIKGKAPRH